MPDQVTQLLLRATDGNREAIDRLLPLVYDELKGVARSKLRFERRGHTLNATALVHEAYLKLVDQTRVEWQSRSHFFAVAARAMRRILLNYATTRNSQKRGGGRDHAALEDVEGLIPAELFSDQQATELLALEEALGRLCEFNPQGAEVVECRFFGGLSHREIGEVMGVAEVTVRRKWTIAKAWLRREMDADSLERSETLLSGANPRASDSS